MTSVQGVDYLFFEILVERSAHAGLVELIVALSLSGLDNIGPPGIHLQGGFVFRDGLALLAVLEKVFSVVKNIIRIEMADLGFLASGQRKDNKQNEDRFPIPYIAYFGNAPGRGAGPKKFQLTARTAM